MQTCRYYIGEACASYPCGYSCKFACSSCPKNNGCSDCIFSEDPSICPLLREKGENISK